MIHSYGIIHLSYISSYNWFWLESCCSSSNWWLNCYWLFRTIHNSYREQRLTYQSISFLFISQLNSSLRAGRKLVSELYFMIVYDQNHYFFLGLITTPKMANIFSRYWNQYRNHIWIENLVSDGIGYLLQHMCVSCPLVLVGVLVYFHFNLVSLVLAPFQIG